MSKFKVPYIDLGAHYLVQEEEIVSEFKRIMEGAHFILRDDVDIFEKNMANYLGVPHVIGVNSGTDALMLSVSNLGLRPGDEIITVAYTFVASVSAIVHNRGVPVFADIGDDFNMDVGKIEELITDKTKAVMPVHMNGRICDMDALQDICSNKGLAIVEDAAQATGSKYKGKSAGSFGVANSFSLHPMKTLSCAGDGGFVSTHDDKIAERIRLMRNHGQKTKVDLEFFGVNSRLDNLQAALINVRMKKLDHFIQQRRKTAKFYNSELSELPLSLPVGLDDPQRLDTFNSYVVQTPARTALHEFLKAESIETMIPMPKPLYLQEKLQLPRTPLPRTQQTNSEALSLPVFPEISEEQREHVTKTIKRFFSSEKWRKS